jgi:hypothetical protein
MCRRLIGVFIVLATAVTAKADPAKPTSSSEVEAAISRGLKVLERGAENYPKHRQCFSCHHQTLPMLAIREARAANIDASKQVLKSQAAFSLASFKSRAEDLKKGEHVGGRAFTVGYGLWSLDLAGHQSDDTTDAMVQYLLKIQTPAGCWVPQTDRPPLEISRVSCTAIAAYGLHRYGQDRKRPPLGETHLDRAREEAIAKARAWLQKAPLNDNEDLAFALWIDSVFNEVYYYEIWPLGGEFRKKPPKESILEAQRADGGWAQKSDMQSDAYATGQTLWALRQVGISTSDPAIQRGVAFLLRTQKSDGSWLVETRSKPIQKFFDNGDPHGKSQFISITATGWAVAALATTLVDAKLDTYPRDRMVRLAERDGRLDIAIEGQNVASYVYDDAKIRRPFFANLKLPGDIEVTRRHPPVEGRDPADHDTMHPGLWLAFGDLSGEDFWRNRGRVVQEKLIDMPANEPGAAWFVVQNRYESADGKRTIAREKCRWVIAKRDAGYLYICDSMFSPVDGELVFGDQEEMGLGIRLATPLAVKNGGAIRDSEGRTNEKEVWGKTAKWCDYRGVVDGVNVGALVMPDPKNFRPSWMHAHDYGVLVANPFGQNAFTKGEKSKLPVSREHPLHLRYGVLLHSHASADDFQPEKAYEDFVKYLEQLTP